MPARIRNIRLRSVATSRRHRQSSARSSRRPRKRKGVGRPQYRQFGKSKLTLKEQKKYIRHLRRLFIYKYPNWSCLTQFMVVGSSGALVNLAILSCLLVVNVPVRVAVALGILVSMTTNFTLNRRFTFGFARDGSIYRHFLGFVASCSLGAVVNYVTTLSVLAFFPVIKIPQVAALFGIGAGTAVNFLTSRHIIFRNPSSPVQGDTSGVQFQDILEPRRGDRK